MGFTVVTVTGHYLDTDGITPSAGRVSFKLSDAIQDSTSNEIIPAETITEKLDSNGRFVVDLVANDDSTTQPVGTTYMVTESIRHSKTRSYSIELMHSAPTVDLADLTPAIAASAAYNYVLVSTFNNHLTTSGAHTAANISVASGAGVTATDVQGAIAEIVNDILNQDFADAASLTAEINARIATLAAEAALRIQGDSDTLVAAENYADSAAQADQVLPINGVPTFTYADLTALDDGSDDYLGPPVAPPVSPTTIIDANGSLFLAAAVQIPLATMAYADADVAVETSRALAAEASNTAAVATEIARAIAAETAVLLSAQGYADLVSGDLVSTEGFGSGPTLSYSFMVNLENDDEFWGSPPLYDESAPTPIDSNGNLFLAVPNLVSLAPTSYVDATFAINATSITAETARATNAESTLTASVAALPTFTDLVVNSIVYGGI